ncbi:hypothetical protein [Rhodococcoides fascians]|uniref:hypothetical protein n=1 Tax=Rhodococcoides fascians TaxID=1828 RepID=UPI0012D3477A|nr:hypothetical protein [Rhodococcus fascians]
MRVSRRRSKAAGYLRTQIPALNLDLAADQALVHHPGPSAFQDVRRTAYRLSYPVSLP